MYGKCNRWRVSDGNGYFETVTWVEADAIAKQFRKNGARNVKIEDLLKLPPYKQKEVKETTLTFFENEQTLSENISNNGGT